MHKNATQLPKPHLTVINWDDRPSIVFYFTHNGSPYKPVFMVNPNFVSPFCALCARATSCKESCSSGCSPPHYIYCTRASRPLSTSRHIRAHSCQEQPHIPQKLPIQFVSPFPICLHFSRLPTTASYREFFIQL